MNLKKRVLFGSAWSLASNGGEQLIRLLLFIYVARKLTPADVGLIALAMVFIDILSFVTRFGQVEAIQRQSSLDDRTLSTSFWLLAGGGLVVAGLIAAGAEVSIRWWDVGLLGTLLLTLSPICALRALNAVPEAILRHRFAYRSLALRSWLATLIGGGTAAYLAYLGYGVYALVAQRLINALVGTVVTWAALGWRPRLNFDRVGARRLLGSGFVFMTNGFAGLINQNLVQAITGFVLGATQLGVLRLGWRFFDFVSKTAVQPISRVTLSTFSQLQNDVEALKRAYLRLSQFMALAALPMFIGLGIVADVLVPLILGAQWTGAIIVMQLLAFARLPAPVGYFFGPAMIAMGKTRALIHQSAFQISLTIALVSIGTLFGIVGVLVAIILRGVVMTTYNISVLHKEIGLEPLAVIRVLVPPVVACATMAAAVEFAKFQLTGDIAPALLLALLVVVGAVTYGITLLLGDAVHLWPGYIRGAASSLSQAVRRGPKVAATPA
jgi:O-antigen/teichoic acid export membrane protein